MTKHGLAVIAWVFLLGPLVHEMGVVSTGLSAQEDDAAAVLAVVESLFDGMREGDADAMAALFHEDVRLVTTGTQEGAPVVRVVEIDGWLEGVAASTRILDEQLHDIEVRISQGLATVWTGYDLYVDGVHSHCGVDAFQLVRTGEGWKIIQIADTRSREGCRG